jgi:hypothetical protein
MQAKGLSMEAKELSMQAKGLSLTTGSQSIHFQCLFKAS